MSHSDGRSAGRTRIALALSIMLGALSTGASAETPTDAPIPADARSDSQTRGIERECLCSKNPEQIEAYLREAANRDSSAVSIDTRMQSATETVCLIGRWDGYPGDYCDVWGDGNYAYLPNWRSADGQPARVHVIDISNPTAPILDETLLIPAPNDEASPQDVKVGDGLLFVALEANANDSVVIYDVRNPANRQLIAAVRIAGFESLHNLFYDSGFLYLPDGNEIAIVDLTAFNPDNPPAATITTAKWIITNVGTQFVHDVTVRNGRLYAAAWDSGLWVYDISDVANTAPAFLGSVGGDNTHSMWPTDDGQFVVTGEERGGGGITVYRITDNIGSLSFALTDSLVLPNVSSVHNQVMVGNRLYNSWYARGMEVYDIDASGLLSFVASYDTSDSGLGNWGIYPLLGSDRILLSDRNEGMFIVSVGTAPCACPPSLPPLPETIDFQVNAKNRFLSVTAGEPGRTQGISVRAVSLPPPFDTFNDQRWFAGDPVQVCENSGQSSNVRPPDCGPSDGLPQAWSWFAPLKCDPLVAEFRDWTALANFCVGGANDGGPCAGDGDCLGGSCGSDPTVHLYHPGLVPSRLSPGGGSLAFPAVYDVQMVDVSCDASLVGSYSDPLVMTQAAHGDIIRDVTMCPNRPPNLTVDVVGDVVSLVNKFVNRACAPKKAMADVQPAMLDFKITIADVVAALSGFGGNWYPFVPGDPCAFGRPAGE